MEASRLPYQLMNVMGGICLVISSYATNDRPNLFTNLIWIFIGLHAIRKYYKFSKGRIN